MKANRSLLVTFLLSALFLLGSCADKDNEKGGAKGTDNQSINEWIYDEMSQKYFWNEQIPASSKMDYTIAPDYFFYRSLYNYNLPDGDRFSYLENNKILYSNPEIKSRGEIVGNELGFEYIYFTNLNLYCVMYVKEGTDAAQSGLKRGDLIQEVNKQTITANNWRTLLSSGSTHYELKIFQNENNHKQLSFNTTRNYKENPLALHKIIEIGDKKIGYILYNFFANDSDDGTMEYAVAMNNAFNEFKNKGVNDLVLDLRYNRGGYVSSGNYIASAIVPNRGTGAKKIYTTRKFNKTYDASLKKYSNYEELVTEFFSDQIKDKNKKVLQDVARLEMPCLYVITSQNTASASEQIINGLGAYIDVRILGETTTGKNMESFAITNEENKDITWILHPLTSKSFNSNGFGEYQSGFKPTIPTLGKELDEYNFHRDENNFMALYPLGDPNEFLLSKVIENITGKVKTSIRSQGTVLRVKAIGSSLDRKRNHMIIENPEVE